MNDFLFCLFMALWVMFWFIQFLRFVVREFKNEIKIERGSWDE